MMNGNDLSVIKKNFGFNHIYTFVNMAVRLVIDGEPQIPTSDLQPDVSQTVIDPTFLLRGIDVSRVVQDYFAGNYKDIGIPTTKVNTIVRGVVADYSVGADDRSEIYEYIDRSGQRQRVITVNHKNYDNVNSKLVNNSYIETLTKDESSSSLRTIGDLPLGDICLWCRRKFSFGPVGIPIQIEYLERENKTIYHTIGSYCTYECCFSTLKLNTRCPFTYRNHRYMDSESILRSMYERVYPGEHLKEQNDWMLAQWNGGPLNEDDFFSKSHVYCRDLSLVLLPAKYEYSLKSTARASNTT